MTPNVLGTTINSRYRIDQELGRGGMGIVYRAFDTTLQREVAVKLLSSAKLGAEGQARLLREAQTIAQLDHPNIVSIFDAGDYMSSPFIVMQLVEGGTLHDKRPSALDEILSIIKQLCLALEHAHQHGVIHRDLKPENVALSEDRSAKLMDFGLARSVASRMTTEGTIVGTVFYMAPEQALGDELDARADLYALGVMMFELVTGRLPFEGDGPVAIITQHLNAPVVPPASIVEDLPAYLDNLILRLLEKTPADRPASAAEVLKILNSPEETAPKESREHSALDRIVRGRIVGRQEEYQEARLIWQKSLNGSGQTLLISGEPGIGKTRLMQEIVTQSELSGGRVFIGEAYAESSQPYGPFAQIVRTALDRKSNNGLMLADFVLADVLKLVPDLRPYYPDIQPNPELDPESEQARLFENLVSFFVDLSATAPLLLVLDDAHWSDSSSIALFQHLARRTKKQPIMLLATYREVELREARPFGEMLMELNRQRLGKRIKLNRLNEASTRAMLEAIFDEQITPDFLKGIYQETDGNPFFIEEVCRALVESGKLVYSAGEWHRPSIDELEIPQGIQVAVESRLSKLPEDVQDVLRTAAILGREFDFEVLIEASNLDEDQIIDAVELADRAQMVQEGRTDTLYEFVHALVPQSIVENTHRLRRRKLHKRAAAAFEIVQPDNFESLAFHHSEGGNDDQALHFYILAGQRALANYANQDAENHIVAALNLTDDLSTKAKLFADLAEAQSRLSRFDDAVQNWSRAVDILLDQGNTDLAAQLYARQARIIWESGDTQAGLDKCREGLSIVEGGPKGPGLAHLLSETARACYFNGLREEAATYADQALDLADQFNIAAVKADTLITLSSSLGPSSSEAVPMLKEAAEIAQAANLIDTEMRAHNNLGVLLAANADFEITIEQYRRAAKLARQKGDLNQQLFYSSNELYSLLFLGQIRQVDRRQVELRLLMDDLPVAASGKSVFNGQEALLAYSKGDFPTADRLWEKNIQAERDTNNLSSLQTSLLSKSNILQLFGDLEGAEQYVEEAIDSARGFPFIFVPYCWASIIAAKRGDSMQARNSLELARDSLGTVTPVFMGQSFLIRAEGFLHAAEGQWELAWTKFNERIQLLTGKKMRFASAWAVLDWADAHLLRGSSQDLVEARKLINQARVEFEDIGADGWLEFIDENYRTLLASR